MKAIVSVYANALDSDPAEMLEFTGTRMEVSDQISAWANAQERVIFDLEVIEDGQMQAVYGLTTGGRTK